MNSTAVNNMFSFLLLSLGLEIARSESIVLLRLMTLNGKLSQNAILLEVRKMPVSPPLPTLFIR